MGAFTKFVAFNSACEKVIRSMMKIVFEEFHITDFEGIDGTSGLLFAKGSLALRVVGVKYTHVAIHHNGYVYESTDKFGVRRLTLDDFLSEYVKIYNSIHYYQFNRNYVPEQLIHEFKKVEGKPYTTNAHQFMCAKYKCNKIDELKTFFCSEFVAYMLEQMRILNKDILPNNFTPIDFLKVKLIEGYELIRVW